MAKVAIEALGITLTIKGDNVLFNQTVPRNQYNASCIHTLYDTGCSVSRSANTFSTVVAASPASNYYNVAIETTFTSDLSQFYLGYVQFTSGAAAGTQRLIAAYDNDPSNFLIGFTYPLDALPAPGDTFNIIRGCDKLLTTCNARFANTQNWRGFPYVPPAETAW